MHDIRNNISNSLNNMAKFICSTCGYVHEDITAPESCPVCMAPSSNFEKKEEMSLPEERITDNEVDGKINENPEIRAKEDEKIESTNNNSNVLNTEESIDSINQTNTEEEDTVNMFKTTNDMIKVVKWYKETYNVGLKESKERVEYILGKNGLKKPSASGNGCMITVLIAITSSLSVVFFL